MFDWVVNAGACISELIDDGLDLVRDGTNAADNALREASDYMSKNTWAIVHYPVNTVLTVVRKPIEITNDVATVTDDYLYEDEKREIQCVESEFQRKEEEKVHVEAQSVDQLHNDAEKYAEELLQSMQNNPQNDTQQGITHQNAQTDNSTVLEILKTAGMGIGAGAVAYGSNVAYQHNDDFTK